MPRNPQEYDWPEPDDSTYEFEEPILEEDRPIGRRSRLTGPHTPSRMRMDFSDDDMVNSLIKATSEALMREVTFLEHTFDLRNLPNEQKVIIRTMRLAYIQDITGAHCEARGCDERARFFDPRLRMCACSLSHLRMIFDRESKPEEKKKKFGVAERLYGAERAQGVPNSSDSTYYWTTGTTSNAGTVIQDSSQMAELEQQRQQLSSYQEMLQSLQAERNSEVRRRTLQEYGRGIIVQTSASDSTDNSNDVF